MVSKLAADGLLARGRAAADGRSVRLTVTDQGAARVAQGGRARRLVGRLLDVPGGPDYEVSYANGSRRGGV